MSAAANFGKFASGDTVGDGVADFLIRIDGVHTLSAADFML